MRNRAVAILTAVLLSAAAAYAQDGGIISGFRDTYFTGGIPLDRKISDETIDLKFQVSAKLRPIALSDNWEAFFGYTQVGVWNGFCLSQPFHDLTFLPGIYFQGKLKDGSRLCTGLEHRSNGRPYFGSPAASEGYDDLSRGMNYAFVCWSKKVGRSEFISYLKAGVGCGVGEYEDHLQMFTQDLFLNYLGYFTFSYRYDSGRFGVHASVTPIWNEYSPVNLTLEASAAVLPEGWPRIFLQFHRGYDEALCDCRKGQAPPCSLRIGLSYLLHSLPL